MSRPPPRYSTIVPETSSTQSRLPDSMPGRSAGPLSRERAVIPTIPSRHPTQLPEPLKTPLYRSSDHCRVIYDEAAILDPIYVKNDLEGLVKEEVDNRLTVKAGEEVVVSEVVSRKCVVDEDTPASTSYALYKVVYYKTTSCTLPRGSPVQVKKSDLKKDRNDAKSSGESFSIAEFCYMHKTVGDILEGSRVWVHSVIPLSGRRALSLPGNRYDYEVMKVQQESLKLPYIIDRHLVHGELEDV